MLLLRQYLRRDAAPARHRRAAAGDRPARPAARGPRAGDRDRRSRLGARHRLALNVAIDYSARDAIANAATCWLGDDSASRTGVRPAARLAGPRHRARRRPADPHRRREAALGFPALGERLRGALLRRHLLARLRRRAPARRDPHFHDRERRFGGLTLLTLPQSKRQFARRGATMTDATPPNRSLRSAGPGERRPRPPVTPPDLVSLSFYKIGADRRPRGRHRRAEPVYHQLGRGARDAPGWCAAGVHPQLGTGAEPLQPDPGDPLPGRRPPAPIPQDRAGAARPRGGAEPAGAQARPVPRDRVRRQGGDERRVRGSARGTPARFRADKDARFVWNEASIAFGAATSLTGLRASDNIVVDNTEQQWIPCLEALRQESGLRRRRAGARERAAAPAGAGTARVRSNRS